MLTALFYQLTAVHRAGSFFTLLPSSNFTLPSSFYFQPSPSMSLLPSLIPSQSIIFSFLPFSSFSLLLLSYFLCFSFIYPFHSIQFHSVLPVTHGHSLAFNGTCSRPILWDLKLFAVGIFLRIIILAI